VREVPDRNAALRNPNAVAVNDTARWGVDEDHRETPDSGQQCFAVDKIWREP
jgi:hypothetical protein